MKCKKYRSKIAIFKELELYIESQDIDSIMVKLSKAVLELNKRETTLKFDSGYGRDICTPCDTNTDSTKSLFKPDELRCDIDGNCLSIVRSDFLT